jgi:hypothetical protein
LSTLPFWGRNGPSLSGDLLLSMSDKRLIWVAKGNLTISLLAYQLATRLKKLYNNLMHLHQYITIELENSIFYRCLYTCGWERIVETDNTRDISYLS